MPHQAFDVVVGRHSIAMTQFGGLNGSVVLHP